MAELAPKTAKDSQRWSEAIEQYNQVMQSNALRRLGKMSENDLKRYGQLHNIRKCTRDDVLRHLIAASTIDITSNKIEVKSTLLGRLLDRKPAFSHVPPHSFGNTWHDLVDEDSGEDRFSCFVKVFGLGRRESDRSLPQSIWLFEVNECLWECRHSNEAGLLFISLDQQWKNADDKDRPAIWEKIKKALFSNIEFDLHYGTWEKPFKLFLTPMKQGLKPEAISDITMPDTSDLFGITRTDPSFPFFWELHRYR